MRNCNGSCLEALERAVSEHCDFLNSASNVGAPGGEPRRLAIMDMRHAIRAALRSPEPVAGKDEERINRLLARVKELEAANLTYPQYSELARLRAWEKWGREHAKPALAHYNAAHIEDVAAKALFALPKDSPEGAL